MLLIYLDWFQIAVGSLDLTGFEALAWVIGMAYPLSAANCTVEL